MADQPRDGVPLAAFLSFRFGATDGVSVVTRTWIAAFESFGFRRWSPLLAMAMPATGWCPGSRSAGEPPSPGLLAEALDDVDLCVVENLLTIPLNLPAARAVACAGRADPPCCTITTRRGSATSGRTSPSCRPTIGRGAT